MYESIFFNKDFIYLTEREYTSRGRSRDRQRKAGFSTEQGALYRIQPQDPGTMTRAKGKCSGNLAT